MVKMSMGAVALLFVAVTTEAFAQSGKSAVASGTIPAPSRKPAFAATQSPPVTPPAGPKSTSPPTTAQTGSPWNRSGQSKADWLLDKRLDSLDHMREIAAKNGNERMLEQADKLEALARRQYQRRIDHSDPPDPATP